MTHTLKTLPAYWDAVERGEKTFEVRRDDRGFQKGDELQLLRSDGVHIMPPGGLQSAEWAKAAKERSIIRRRISYILTGGQFGIEPGFVVLGLAPAANSHTVVAEFTTKRAADEFLRLAKTRDTAV
jgi:hypothetical protein